jgi:hypothetical protein
MIDREHHAEMAYVDEVINGICGAAEDIMSGGQGIKQSGNNGVKGESSNVRQRCGDEVTSPQTKKGNTVSQPHCPPSTFPYSLKFYTLI